MTIEDGRTLHERIAVGVDGSAVSRAALRWAICHAREGDTITLVHVWSASPAMVNAGLCEPDDDAAARAVLHREVLRARELVPDEACVTLTQELLHGDARHSLAEFDTDVLVVGTGDHDGIGRRLLGSVSDYLARHATVPVVLVPLRRR